MTMIRGILVTSGAKWRTVGLALFLLLARCGGGHPEFAWADDPMNQPLDSVGVKGYDAKLCNDQWNTCGSYDRQQFDTKYPGTSLDSISLYPLKESSSYEVYRDSEFSEAEASEYESDGEAGDE